MMSLGGIWDGMIILMNGGAKNIVTNVSAMSSGGFRTTHYQNTTNEYRKHKR